MAFDPLSYMSRWGHKKVLLCNDQDRRSREYYFNYRIAAVYTAAEVAEAIGGHLAIGQAIQRREPEAAERLARAHVHEALEDAVIKL
ncbi:MAG: hypothetical protein ACRDPY_19420 [Streptosporangiaceae bacterium]